MRVRVLTKSKKAHIPSTKMGRNGFEGRKGVYTGFPLKAMPYTY
jgi:hypothetical protein